MLKAVAHRNVKRQQQQEQLWAGRLVSWIDEGSVPDIVGEGGGGEAGGGQSRARVGHEAHQEEEQDGPHLPRNDFE